MPSNTEPPEREAARQLLRDYDHDVRRVLQLCAYEMYLAEACNDERAYNDWHRVSILVGRAVRRTTG